jgi:hypothetical protein
MIEHGIDVWQPVYHAIAGEATCCAFVHEQCSDQRQDEMAEHTTNPSTDSLFGATAV